MNILQTIKMTQNITIVINSTFFIFTGIISSTLLFERNHMYIHITILNQYPPKLTSKTMRRLPYLQDQEEQLASHHVERERHTIEIRRQKREEIFNAKRLKLPSNKEHQKNRERNATEASQQELQAKVRQEEWSIEDMNHYTSLIFQEELTPILKGIQGLRYVLTSCRHMPMVPELIARIIELTQVQEYPDIQVEAGWCLANISACLSQNCNTIVKYGGVQSLVKMLNFTPIEIPQQALWALSNLAADNHHTRDLILQTQALERVMSIVLDNNQNIQTVQNAIWTILNLIGGSQHQKVKKSMPFLAKTIALGMISDDKMLGDCLISLAQHCPPSIQSPIIKQNLLQEIIQKCLVKEASLEIISPTLTIIGKLVSGSNENIKYVCLFKPQAFFLKCLRINDQTIRQQMCWILSNIAASDRKNTNKICMDKDILYQIVHMLQNDSEDIRGQLCYFFYNLAFMFRQRISVIIFSDSGLIESLTKMLYCEDIKHISIAIKTLRYLMQTANILDQNEEIRTIHARIAQVDAYGILDQLQDHIDPQIHNEATLIFAILRDYLARNVHNNELQYIL